MNKSIFTLFFTLTMFLSASVAFAHAPSMTCSHNGDGTVTCEGGFSDGSKAVGVNIIIKDGTGKVITQGKFDHNSEYTFDKPEGAYSVTFDDGRGHSRVLDGSKIVE